MRKRELFLALVAVVAVASGLRAESTIDSTNKWAWVAGAGWIDCRVDASNGVVVGEFVCSGFMYSPATGWIHLGSGAPTNGYAYGNAATNDYGVNHDGKGNLRGYAWSDTVEWIAFEDSGAPSVDLRTGMINGLAYSPALGWVSLSNTVVSLQTKWLDPGPDDDADGIPDMWEYSRAGNTTMLKGGEDADLDGIDDDLEYTADTDPANSNEFFAIDAFALTDPGDTAEVTWASSPTRLYAIQTNSALNPTGWTDVAELGLISPASDTNHTMRAVPGTTPSNEFYRVRAVHPLAP